MCDIDVCCVSSFEQTHINLIKFDCIMYILNPQASKVIFIVCKRVKNDRRLYTKTEDFFRRKAT